MVLQGGLGELAAIHLLGSHRGCGISFVLDLSRLERARADLRLGAASVSR